MRRGSERAVTGHDDDSTPQCTSASSRSGATRSKSKTGTGTWKALAFVIVLAQTLWAVVIPIKNVVIIPYPKITENYQSVQQHQYERDSDQIATRKISGQEAYRIVKEVVELSLTNQVLRGYFETRSDFVIDDISHLLTPEQHQLFGQYYTLLFQASEMLAGGVIQREQAAVVLHPDTNEEVPITITCTREQVFQGMRCTNPKGIMCDDIDWQDVNQLTLTPIDLATLTNGTGWHNKVSLMGFISITHNAMRLLFERKDWNKAFDVMPIAQLFTDPISDPIRLNSMQEYMAYASPWNPRGMDDYLRAGIRKFESCFNTEFILGYFHASVFAARIIQKSIMALNLYGAIDRLNTTITYDQDFEEMFQHDIFLTTSAGDNGLVDNPKTFLGAPMTEFIVSTVNWKKDRPMTGPIPIGSAPRNLEYWIWYPDQYYSFHNDSLQGDTVVVEYRELGGYHSGFNGFKYDLVRNTMGVIRLAERRWSKGTGYAVDWFDQEKQISQWYRKHELNDSNSLVRMAEALWGVDYERRTWQIYCMEALYRMIAQTVWIMALQKQPVMNHLVYQSMIDPDTPAAWWFKQLTVNQIVGEQITGYRVAYPYFRDTYWVVDGESWVLIPLLNAFRKELGEEKLLHDVMTAMNTTFYDILSVSNGRFIGYCYLGFKTMGVTENDSKKEVYTKLYGTVYKMIQKTINMVDTIHQQMLAAGFHVVIPREYIIYNRTNNVFQWEGPPVYWTHQPLSVGLIKLSTFVSPDDSQMKVLRDSLVCYDTLETRFLNLSTRCWSEPQSVRETFEMATSDGLRMLKFSMWSLGVVLNISGAVVALRFAGHIWNLWVDYRFSDLTVALALNLNFQGIGMISFDGVMIMAFSCVPLILSYHLPDDKQFMPDAKGKPNPVFAECMVLLGLTWFIRLGIECGVKLISLKYYNWWFKKLSTWIRLLTMVVVFGIRLVIINDSIDYNYGLIKLMVSCVVSMMFGFVSVVASVVFDKENAHSTDVLSRMMTKRKLARNMNGVLGQLQSGWSHAGMAMEGWHVFKRKGKVDLLFRGELQWMPMDAVEKDYEMMPLTPELMRDVCKGDCIAPPRDSLLPPVRVAPFPCSGTAL